MVSARCEVRLLFASVLFLHLCSVGSGSGTDEVPSLSLVRGGRLDRREEDGGQNRKGNPLRLAFYKHLSGEDDLCAPRVRSPAPRVNVYGVGSLPRQRHPLAALAGAPAPCAEDSLVAKRLLPALKVLLWLAMRLAHKVAWGMHLLSGWVEERDHQLKLLLARQRGRHLKGLRSRSKLRASPVTHIYSEDHTLGGTKHAIRRLLDSENHRTPGREYVLEMQRQAAGIGYRRRSSPLAAEAAGFLGLFRGADRYGANNIREDCGRDWLLANGRGGEVG